MKHITRVIHRYECGTCGGEYRSKKETLQCERLPIEVPKFRGGQRVRGKFKRHPCCCRKARLEGFSPSGTVAMVVGPVIGHPVAEERLGVYEVNDGPWVHVYQYTIAFGCLFCKAKHDDQRWTNELSAIAQAKKNSSRKAA